MKKPLVDQSKGVCMKQITDLSDETLWLFVKIVVGVLFVAFAIAFTYMITGDLNG